MAEFMQHAKQNRMFIMMCETSLRVAANSGQYYDAYIHMLH